MNETEFVRSKVRQRRIALQKSLSVTQDKPNNARIETTKPFSKVSDVVTLAVEKEKKKDEQEEKHIETIAEVLTDISSDVKEELKKKKRRKLRELKKFASQKQVDSVYELDVINRESDNLSFSPDHQENARLLPKSPNRKHGMDNEGWCSEEPVGSFAEQRIMPLHQKISPFKSPGSTSESFASPHRVARRQKIEGSKNDRLQETIINIISSHQIKSEENEGAKKKHRLRRRLGLQEKETSSPYQPAPMYHFNDAEDLVPEEEAYEFFTHVWDDDGDIIAEDTEVKMSPSTNVESEIPEIVISGNEQEETSVLLQPEYFVKDAISSATEYAYPEYIRSAQRNEQQKSFLFSPSRNPVSLSARLPEDTEPSSVADPATSATNIWITSRNINVMENRLVREKALHWFGEDGHIKFLDDSISEFSLEDHVIDENENQNVIYVKAHNSCCKQRLNEENKHELHLDLSSIAFTHHPLYSKEHVVASRLIHICEKYVAFVQMDVVQMLKQKLKTLRGAVVKLKQVQKLRASYSEDENLQIITRLKAYSEEIRQTRKTRDMKELEQRNLIDILRSSWNELKSIRDSQKYNSTSIRIEITEIEQDEAKDTEEFEKEIMQELEEEKEDFEHRYVAAMSEYNTSLSIWKKWNKAKKEATKRQKKRNTSRRKSSAIEEADSPTNEDLELTDDMSDEQILSGPQLEKPQIPSKFDAKKMLEKLTQNALKMRNKPGTPKTIVKVEFDLPITPNEDCPKSEIQRRKEISRTSLHFRIMFNDKKVFETSTKNLNQEFHAFWGQIFKIQIVHFPQSFKLELYEGGVSRTTLLAEVYLPIPNNNQTSLTQNLANHQFSSDRMVSSKHNAVGSGVLFNFANGDRSWLLTSGNVRCSLVWAVSEDDTVLAPPKAEESISVLSELRKNDPLDFIFSGNILCLSKLRDELQKIHIDPNDPSSMQIFQVIQDYRADDLDGSDCEKVSEFFRLEPLIESFDFVSMEEIENNSRFHLLELRSKGLPEFRNYEMVPSDAGNISREIIEQLQKLNIDSPADGKDEVATRQPKKIRHKVREEVAKRFYMLQHQKTLEDIVIEEKVPNIGTLGFNLLKLFQRKRPLYPIRKERKKVAGQSAVNSEVKIMVTVLHAINVPVRTDVDPVKQRVQRRDSAQDREEEEFESQVRPFVEVVFQRMAVKTTVADGPHPTWNQQLCLPFRTENGDFSPSSLERVNDVIYFNIFDEVTVDLLQDDKDRESVVHQRLERRWLGNLEIPFATLYLNSKIEGTFQVNSPPVLLGYKSEPRPWLIGDASFVQTHLSLFITIEPCLQLPEVFREKCDSGEPEKILREVQKWQQNVIAHYPMRLIKIMTVDLSGQRIFVSRFLRPISPPEELLQAGKNSVETWEMLARFVSLIPSVSDSVAYPGLCDIWSTSDQFMQMLMGDQEEHSILLCNFFLHLGKKSMLLLGHGIPEGPTAYVITWEDSGDVLLWNASSGDRFSTRDSHSPLQRVGCIISPENVWANIQKSDHPSRVNFDLSKTSDWKPFFHRGFTNPGFRSVQPPLLTYTQTDLEFVRELQETLKRSLQENIMKWRRRHCTSWNSYCNQVLYKILTRLERNSGRTASVDSLQELEQILSSHKMSGFPLCMPYTDAEAVIEAVFSTGVHLTEDKNAEFSLAVYLHPYPCSVIAVWVYVAVLVSRRSPDVE